MSGTSVVKGPHDELVHDTDEILPEDRVGEQVGNYRLEALLGEGGMGVVYKATHVALKREVAVKILNDDYAREKDAGAEMLREAQAAARIRHPNIVDVTDFGTSADGAPYFVMEYLEGESLNQVLHRHWRLDLDTAVYIMRQVASAVGAAHQAGIVHRDLKPENIFLTRQPGIGGGDELDFVKVVDFGIARVAEWGPSEATRKGLVSGTPHYMSPEQVRMRGQVDGRSDIYSAGVIFYRLVTGELPFNEGSAVELMAAHCAKPPVPPSRRCQIPHDVEQIILHCLEKDPAKRYQTMGDLLDDLTDVELDHSHPGVPTMNWALQQLGRPSLKVTPIADPEEGPQQPVSFGALMTGPGRRVTPGIGIPTGPRPMPPPDPDDDLVPDSEAATPPPSDLPVAERELRTLPPTPAHLLGHAPPTPSQPSAHLPPATLNVEPLPEDAVSHGRTRALAAVGGAVLVAGLGLLIYVVTRSPSPAPPKARAAPPSAPASAKPAAPPAARRPPSKPAAAVTPATAPAAKAPAKDDTVTAAGLAIGEDPRAGKRRRRRVKRPGRKRRRAAAKKAAAKKAAAKKAAAKKAAAKKAAAKKAAAKKGDPKKGDPKKGDPKRGAHWVVDPFKNSK